MKVAAELPEGRHEAPGHSKTSPASGTRRSSSVRPAGALSRGRGALTSTLALLCASVALLAFASPAAASVTRPYLCQITASASPSASECNSTGNSVPGGAFTSPYGLAVDSADNLWVSDTGNGAVDKFDSSGNFLHQGSGFAGCGGGYIQGLAYGNAANLLYVADSCSDDLWGINPDGTYANVDLNSGLGGGCCYIRDAVDNSPGATGGDIYVSSGSSVIRIDGTGAAANFSASASYVSANTLTGTLAHSFASPQGLATDSSGNVYVADAGNDEVDEFDSTGTFVQAFTTTPGGAFGSVSAVAIDPTNSNVLILDPANGVIDEFNSTGTFQDQTAGGGAPAGSLGSPRALVVDSSGRLYVSDGSNAVVDAFGSPVTLPDQTTGAVSNLAPVSATLNGTVNPQGVQLTNCRFDYGTDTSYSLGSAPCVPAAASIAADSSDHAVSADISGLNPETTYHFRLAAANANGAGTPGADQTFTTPPAITDLATGSATDLAATSATLNATFTGVGAATRCYFDYGKTTGYGSTSSTPPGTSAGSGSGSGQTFAEAVTGLSPATTYHYRAVCTNSFGTTKDPGDQTFTTPPAVAGLSTDPATNVLATSATLNGSLDPAGQDTTYHFEYVTDFDFVRNQGSGGGDPWSSAQHTPTASTGVLSGNKPVSADIASLTPGTKYHFRIVATNSFGTTIAAGQTFITLGRYRFSSDFGSSGTGDGQLANPRDVAVDNSSGDLYVADTGNHRVVKLDSSGNFIAAWGWGVSDGSAASQVCASGCQAGIPGSGAGQLTTPTFVEVDNSGGPSAGDVYVADTADGVVQKFDPSGNLIASWGSGGAIDFSLDGPVGGITVNTAGSLFVVTDNSPYYWTEVGQDGVSRAKTVTEGVDFGLENPGGTGIDIDAFGGFYENQGSQGGVTFRNPTANNQSAFNFYPFGSDGAPSGLTIDRLSGDLYVDLGDHIDQFAAQTPPDCHRRVAPCPPSELIGTGHLNGAAGLAFNPASGALYAANSGDNNVAVFTPRPLPAVTTDPVTNQAPTSATLTGHLNPNGAGDVTDCHFDYGTDNSYSLGSVPCSQATPISSPTDVSADLSGLTPFTTYHYRLVATGANDQGLYSYGADRSFTPTQGAAPIVDSTSSSGLTQTTATLDAQINPNLATTVYRFQYGASTSYGSQTLVSDPIGSDGVDHAVSTDLSGLIPGTTYHFRVLAVNFNGVTAGPDRTFSTPDLPSVGAEAASAITQTTATLGAQVKPSFSPTTYHFEYGTKASYGQSTPESASIGSDNSVHAASAAISGLSAGTTYHFRIVATNAIGATNGPDQTFTTAPTPVVTPLPSTCKAGFVKRHGKCVRKSHKRHHKKRHHKRSAKHG